MKEFFKMMFASMIGFILTLMLFGIFSFVMMAVVIASLEPSKVSISDNSVLHLKFDHNITDRSSDNPFNNLNLLNSSVDKSVSLRKIVLAINEAKTDKQIKGIFLDLGYIPADIASLEEIREALSEFKKSRKFIYSYADYYDQKTYFLASLADSVFMNPLGGVDFKGLAVEVMYFKNMFDKLEIEPIIIRHGKFKSAVEPFMQDKISPENKEQLSLFVNQIWDFYLDKISEDRKIDKSRLQNYADNLSLMDASYCTKEGIINALAYKEDVTEMIKKKTGIKEDKKLKLVKLTDYIRSMDPDNSDSDNEIAVVYAQGEINGSNSSDNTVGAEAFVKILRDIRKDKDIKSVVLRVNSPGGDGMASELINKEMEKLKKEKPVVVSMGKYAASGGYYISANANKIVADRTTLTGSIGVFSLFFNTQKLFKNKLGINFETVKTNEFSDFVSGVRPMSEFEKRTMQNYTNAFYDTFLTRVAEGRKLSKEKVDELGQGRIWTGIQAQKSGLVDTLGGLELAINIASDLAKIKSYRITYYPPKEIFLNKFLDMLSDEIHVYSLERQFGENYKILLEARKLLKYSGLQTRMISIPDLKF